jgi:hypothetical protein
MKKRTATGIALIVVAAVIAVAVIAINHSVRGKQTTSTSSSTSPLRPGTASGFPTSRGVYVVSSFSPPKSVDSPTVDGFFQSYKWSDVEPADGHYDWSQLDSDLGQIKAAGKHATLGIVAGAYTPAWAEPQHATFVVAPHNGETGGCREIVDPVPWNTTYQSNLHQMMQQLRQNLSAQGLYATVTQLKITGVNEYTDETRLPAEPGTITCTRLKRLDGTKANGAAAAGVMTTDATAIWQSLGYTRTKAEDAWKAIADDWATTFPDKTLAMPAILTAGFPGIDDSGKVVTSRDTSTTQDLAVWAARRWGPRFMLMHTSLRDNFKAAGSAEVRQAGASIGFQLAENQFDTKRSLPSDASFQDAVHVGVSYGMQYLEIWPPDISNYASTLPSARSAFA